MGVPMNPKDNFPALPTMFEKLAPTDLPNLDYNEGLIGGWRHKKKIKNIAESEKYQAEISDARLRQVENNAKMMKSAIMFSKQIQVEMARYDAEMETMKLNFILKQEITREQMLRNEGLAIKNDILKVERSEARLSYKMKLKDLGVSDDWENEDRNG